MPSAARDVRRLRELVSVLALASCNGGCDFAIAVLPERMAVDDPRLQPMYEAIAQRTDRPMMEFTPLPAGDQAKDVRLQALAGSGYDAMLYVVGKSSRRVAFKRTQQGYGTYPYLISRSQMSASRTARSIRSDRAL